MKTSIGTLTAEERQDLEADQLRILLEADATPGARLERPPDRLRSVLAPLDGPAGGSSSSD